MSSLLRIRDMLRLPPAAAARHVVRGARTALQAAAENRLEDRDFAHAWAACSDVPGWLDRKAARLLFGLARRGPGEGWIVEVGSYLGRSTIVLALGSAAAQRERVAAIDPHRGELVPTDAGTVAADTHPLFLRNLAFAGVEAVVEPIKATSADAAASWDRPVRLLYVDGLHDYDSVKVDIALWTRHLADGAVVVFDDWDVGDVRRAVHEAQAGGLLPQGVVPVGEAAVCGFRDARSLRPYVLPAAD
jgi:hypothetical protein